MLVEQTLMLVQLLDQLRINPDSFIMGILFWIFVEIGIKDIVCEGTEKVVYSSPWRDNLHKRECIVYAS